MPEAAARVAASDSGLLDTLDEYLAGWESAARRDPQIALTAAALQLKQGNHAAALQGFDRLLAQSPDDPMVITGKAMALGGLGQHDDALVLLENVARRDPKDAAALYNLAVAQMRAGERAAAVATWRKVLELQPRHTRARFNLGILLQAMGQTKEAVEIWRELTDNAQQRAALSATMLADAWSHRGETNLRLRQAVEAEKCFQAVAELEPRNPLAWCNVGIARAEQVRRDDAMTALNIALNLDPNLVPALNQVAYLQAAIYRDLGHISCGRAVVDCCRRSLRIKPDQPNIRALLHAARAFDPTDAPPSATDQRK